MTGTNQAVPRLAVWGFGLSLVGCVLSFGSFLGFAEMMRSGVGNPFVAPWGVLSIPGLVLSLWGLRVARKRQAPRGRAKAGLVLGIVGTVVAVLYIAFVIWLIVSLIVSPNGWNEVGAAALRPHLSQARAPWRSRRSGAWRRSRRA